MANETPGATWADTVPVVLEADRSYARLREVSLSDANPVTHGGNDLSVGKILGALIGIRFGPWGALVGFLLGHFLLDRTGVAQRVVHSVRSLFTLKSTRYPVCPLCGEPMLAAAASVYTCPRCSPISRGGLGRLGTRSASFHASLMGTLVALAKADGPLSANEVRAIRDLYAGGLKIPRGQLESVKELLRETARNPPSLRSAALALAGFTDLDERLQIYRICESLSKVDGPPGREEFEALRILRDLFELAGSPLKREGTTPIEDPYDVLGLDRRTATKEAIRQAHRRLVTQYHPDRVAHLAPEFRELAERKFKTIQWAREQLLGPR